MAVSDLMALRERLLALSHPDGALAWALISNYVHHRFEERTVVALFDTREQAQAYADASCLPEPPAGTEKMRWTPDGILRTHSPESLLWDFNAPDTVVRPALPTWDIDGVLVNPEPPSQVASECVADVIAAAVRRAAVEGTDA